MKNVSIKSVVLVFLFILSGCKTYEYQCYDCGIRLNNLYLESSTTKKGKYIFNDFYLSGRYLDFKDFLVFKSDTLFSNYQFNTVKRKKLVNNNCNSVFVTSILLKADSAKATKEYLRRYLIADGDTFQINWKDTVKLGSCYSYLYLYFDYSDRNGPFNVNGKIGYIYPQIINEIIVSEKLILNFKNNFNYLISLSMPYNMWYKKDIKGDTLFKRGDTLWYKKENLYYVPVKKR